MEDQNTQYLYTKKRKLEKQPAQLQSSDTGQACHMRLYAKGKRDDSSNAGVSKHGYPVSVAQLAWNLELREAGNRGGRRFPCHHHPPALFISKN